jgi:2,3-bisphosphoglycerate-dependent phosphoglycerate mutase
VNREIKRLVLVRHGVSTANLDPSEYARVPDHCIRLADPLADAACLAAGMQLSQLGFSDFAMSSLCAWSSPYLRCIETERLVIARAFGADGASIQRRESFLLREQEFGDWDGWSEEEIAARDPLRFAKRERMTDALGRFYFRYPNGESRADVAQRVGLFVGKLQRSRFPCHLIFLHGVTQRAFRLAWLNHSVEWFEREPNPANASTLLIERDSDTGRWVERYL